MNLLLDTHTLIWSLTDDPTLSKEARTAIGNLVDNMIYISTASIWEISIKQSLGRMGIIPNKFYEAVKQHPVEILAITGDHADFVRVLPHYHGDPFDRMLIAQCQVEDLTLVTHDKTIAKYEISILRA